MMKIKHLPQSKLNQLAELPAELVSGLLDVVEMGALKHGAESYLEEGVFTEKRLSSIFRHLMKAAGLYQLKTQQESQKFNLIVAIDTIEDALNRTNILEQENLLDEESGLSHFSHIQCNAAMFDTVINRNILRTREPIINTYGSFEGD